MKEKKKIKAGFWKQCLVFIVLMVPLLGVYPAILNNIASRRDLKLLRSDDFSFVFQVDKVLHEDNNFILDAWAFKLNEVSTKGAMELWLYDLEKERIIYPRKTEFTERLDVNEYFFCEYNYTDCGIVACFNEKKLDLESKDYEVYVFDVKRKKLYQTGTYICDGELMYCLPEKYVELAVSGTDIESIVKDGVLRVYRPDFGIYVYQYDGALYWIAEPYYGFVDGDSTVQFQMETTQIEKLPEHRLANNYFWSNLGFRFKTMELTELNTGKYRVAKCELPLDYSVTDIWTGNYIDGWIWRQDFRRWYDFSE